MEFGDFTHAPLDIFTVRPAERANAKTVAVNFEAREEARPRLPAHLIAFGDSGGGDLLCFDTTLDSLGPMYMGWIRQALKRGDRT